MSSNEPVAATVFLPLTPDGLEHLKALADATGQSEAQVIHDALALLVVLVGIQADGGQIRMRKSPDAEWRHLVLRFGGSEQ